ncbi:MAG: type II toxin-antitoxin system VapC family toxin [Nanoarchaeota archaeon]|nr:type II toxin-antitoxin system VapC family toxin [Nanoarchaeota archaeon]
MPKNATSYCLDTSAVIEVLYATDKGKKIQSITKDEPIVITVFTIHELLVGMKEKEIEKIERFFKLVSVIDFSKESALHSSVIEKHLRKVGRLVNKMDILIAGMCLEKNYHLISCDNDFEHIKGIQTTIL